jgi:4-hydroxythreonine-4-phosphate dehydrogenase
VPVSTPLPVPPPQGGRERCGPTAFQFVHRAVSSKPTIVIPVGDPAGIGPEISLKAALDPRVCAACHPVLVSDTDLLERHADLCGIEASLHSLTSINEADWSDDRVNVLECAQPQMAMLQLGEICADAGRASIAFCRAAVKATLAGEADAVVAAPQNEAAIAQAGIIYDGHPSFVAHETGTDENDVFMMLCFGDVKITHVTLHQSVRHAIAAITREKVEGVIRVTAQTLRRLGIAQPAIAVGGLNPHAGEGGLFGSEETEIIRPAIDAARADGVAVSGPFGADTMFHMKGVDAFIVMLHDQGHIAAKLLAPNAAAALTIGTPILFSSVAHGSAHDIAGKGIADPTAMIDAILRLSRVRAARM